jgi:hypothetical protein
VSEDVDGEPEGLELNIVMTPEMRAGVWANFAGVSHSPYEFTLDFARLEYQGLVPTGGIVVQRVSMSPLFILQLIEALQVNYTQWAAKALPPEAREL